MASSLWAAICHITLVWMLTKGGGRREPVTSDWALNISCCLRLRSVSPCPGGGPGTGGGGTTFLQGTVGKIHLRKRS